MNKSSPSSAFWWIALLILALACALEGPPAKAQDAGYYAQQTYVSTGGSSYSIPFPYLQQSDIHLTDNGVAYTGAITFPSTGVLNLSPAITAGHTVVVRRETGITSAQATFHGGPLASSDLNNNQTQALYSLQETSDGLLNGGGGGSGTCPLCLPISGGTLTGPLTLAADPSTPLGAATKEYVDSHGGGGGTGGCATTGCTYTGNVQHAGGSFAEVNLYSVQPANGAYVSPNGAAFSYYPIVGGDTWDVTRASTYIPFTTVAGAGQFESAFVTNTNFTTGKVKFWTPSTGFSSGDQILGPTLNVYQSSSSCTSAGSGGPTGGTTFGDTVSDGSCTWVFLQNNAYFGKAGQAEFSVAHSGASQAIWGHYQNHQIASGWGGTFWAADEVDVQNNDVDCAIGTKTCVTHYTGGAIGTNPLLAAYEVSPQANGSKFAYHGGFTLNGTHVADTFGFDEDTNAPYGYVTDYLGVGGHRTGAGYASRDTAPFGFQAAGTYASAAFSSFAATTSIGLSLAPAQYVCFNGAVECLYGDSGGYIAENVTPPNGDSSGRIPTTAWVLANASGGGGGTTDGCKNVNAYGADPTGAAFSDTAVANAMAAMATDFPCLRFGSGVYKLTNQILYTFSTAAGSGKDSFSILGNGSDNTRLFWPATVGGAIKAVWNPANGVNQSVNYSGFSVVTGAANGGNAITLLDASSTAGLNTLPSSITDVVIRGDDTFANDYWTTGFNTSGVSEINWVNCAVYGTAGTQLGIGWNIGPGSNPNGAVVFNVVNPITDYLADGFVIGNNTEGYNINGWNCTVTSVCLTMPSGAGDQLTITNSQLEFSVAGISINGNLSNIMINSDLFIVGQSNANAVGISIQPVWVDTIFGNTFNNNGTNTTAVALNGFNGTGATVFGNVYSGTFTAGVLLGSASQSVLVYGNMFNAVTSPIVNSSTSNQIGQQACGGITAGSTQVFQGIITHC